MDLLFRFSLSLSLSLSLFLSFRLSLSLPPFRPLYKAMECAPFFLFISLLHFCNKIYLKKKKKKKTLINDYHPSLDFFFWLELQIFCTITRPCRNHVLYDSFWTKQTPISFAVTLWILMLYCQCSLQLCWHTPFRCTCNHILYGDVDTT